MNWTVVGYVTYLFVSLNLTIWVAWTLSRNGFHFLKDVYTGDETLARAVNHLLVVGFYLINLGYVLLALESHSVTSAQGMIESISGKLGVVLLILGGMHLLNLYVLSRARRTSEEERQRQSRTQERNLSNLVGMTPPLPPTQGA